MEVAQHTQGMLLVPQLEREDALACLSAFSVVGRWRLSGEFDALCTPLQLDSEVRVSKPSLRFTMTGRFGEESHILWIPRSASMLAAGGIMKATRKSLLPQFSLRS